LKKLKFKLFFFWGGLFCFWIYISYLQGPKHPVDDGP